MLWKVNFCLCWEIRQLSYTAAPLELGVTLCLAVGGFSMVDG